MTEDLLGECKHGRLQNTRFYLHRLLLEAELPALECGRSLETKIGETFSDELQAAIRRLSSDYFQKHRKSAAFLSEGE
jgi:hypothetical protein